MAGVTNYGRRLNQVPGWFGIQDFWTFDTLLTGQQGRPGGLLEMGPYLGRSAILIGLHRKSGEKVTVCDLFGGTSSDTANIRENSGYRNTIRETFEQNYQRFVGELPTIIEAPTSSLTARLEPASQRFIHIDASHLYEHVAEDLETARSLLTPDGLVACDDYRSIHTPGTAAAIWGFLSTDSLRPFAITPQKLYAARPEFAELWLGFLTKQATKAGLLVEQQAVRGHPLARLTMPSACFVTTRLDRLERKVLPAFAKNLIDRRRLASQMFAWVAEQPMIAAELSARVGRDIQPLVPGLAQRAAHSIAMRRGDSGLVNGANYVSPSTGST